MRTPPGPGGAPRGRLPGPVRTPSVTVATRLFWPEPAAASFRLAAVSRGLANAGVAVTVLTSRYGEAASNARLVPGVRIRRWPVLRDETGTVRGYGCYLSFDGPLLLRLLATRRSTVVLSEPPPTTGIVSWLVARARRQRFAYFLPDVWSDGATAMGSAAIVGKALRVMESFVLRRADCVLAVSQEMAASALRLGAHPDRIHVVGNGVDDTVFRPDGERAPAPGPTFVHAGTISQWQGVDLIIRAFPRVLADHPNARLIFIGQGTEQDELQQLAARVAPPEAITFTGVLSAPQTAQYLRSATAALACVKADSGYHYARPTKVFAANACGAPVIYIGPGPQRTEIEQHQLGWAVDYDIDAVADAMLRAIKEPVAEPDRARIADWTIENFSLSSVGARAVQALAPLWDSPQQSGEYLAS